MKTKFHFLPTIFIATSLFISCKKDQLPPPPAPVAATSIGQWNRKADFGGLSRAGAVGFSIGTLGYIGTGMDSSTFFRDFWEWNQVDNTWMQKADFGGTARANATGFSTGGKGYIGTGQDSSGNRNDFWEWDQVTNSWNQKAAFPGSATSSAGCFSIGSKGYIGTGNQFYEYDVPANSWSAKAMYPGTSGISRVGFSIDNKGYFISVAEELWEWDANTNTWLQKATIPYPANIETGFSMDSKGYVLKTDAWYNFETGERGWAGSFWEWDPTTNTWTQKQSYSGGGVQVISWGLYGNISKPAGFSIGNKAYVGTGRCATNYYEYYRDFWEFTQ